MKNIKYILIGFLVIGFFLPKTVFGIGQVTKPIVVENALRGQKVTAKLTFINSKDSEIIYGLMAEGDIAEWTTFYTIADLEFVNPITEIKINPAITQNAIAKFTIPDDQPNGTYTGKVYVFEAPKNNGEADKKSIKVRQRIGRSVSITVSAKEIIKLESLIVPLTYEVKNGEPLQIKIIHNNLGNIAIKPSIQLKAAKGGKEIFNAIFPYPESEKAVKPLERKTMPTIEWQTTGLKDGDYFLEINVLINDEVIKRVDHRLIIGNYVKPFVTPKQNEIFMGIAGIAGIFGNNIIKFMAIFLVVSIFLLYGVSKSKKKEKIVKKIKIVF